jgi:hypothetical protein
MSRDPIAMWFGSVLTEESDVIQSSGSIKQLERNLSRHLIWARETDNRKDTLNELSMNCCTESYARAQD